MPMAKKKRGNRGRARMMRAQGYADAGASLTKRSMRDFTEQSGSPARDIDDNNETLRQRARQLYMGAPIATSAIRTVRTNAIGEGLFPKPRPDRDVLGMTQEEAQTWAKHAQREFALWADDKRACDATSVNTFYEMQQLAMQSWLTSGDVFAVIKRRKAQAMRPYKLRLHLVEADRIATPTSCANGITPAYTTGENSENGNRIFDGVEINSDGEVVAYHIRRGYPADWAGDAEQFTRVLAMGRKTGLPNVLHVMESERPDQYRGVSYLAQVIEPLLQLRRYTSSELTAAVVESFFTAFVKVEGAYDNPFNETGAGIVGADGGLSGIDGAAREEISHDPDEYEMGPGQVNFLEPGEDIAFADPKRPSSGFEAFMQAMCRQVGAALEIPGELLLKTFNSSYSASRAALMEAWKAFRMRRGWFVADFCQPVWEIWLSEAIALGRIDAPGYFADPLIRAAYLGCEWVGPSQGQLDPTKEIAAEVAAIEQGVTTREAAATRLNGSNWDENMDRLHHEQQRMADLVKIGATEEERNENAQEFPGR